METRSTRRRWMRRLLVLAIPAAALPVMWVAPASADHVACIEVSPTPTECGTGDPVGVAICGVEGEGTQTRATQVNPPSGGSADVVVNGEVVGFDSHAEGLGGQSPEGWAVVWVDDSVAGGAHVGIGSTTNMVNRCP